jgi:hypothetical protein
MTIAAQQFLNSFDSLPEVDQHAVAVEILRRVSSSAPHDLSDETLIAAAEDLFRALDTEEATNARP